jgi:hypothetical protein
VAENLTLRQLGSVGIVSDAHPYDLPPQALSSGVNIRFDHGKISRAPVPRRIFEFTGHDPRVHVLHPAHRGRERTANHRLQGLLQGLLRRRRNPVGRHPYRRGSERYWGALHATFLGNIAYLNRRSFVPLKLSVADATFQELPNWDATWRAGVLRSYKDFLVALNISKGANDYPSMVKWSDAALYNAVPGSWDAADPTVLAGENTLTDMRGTIIDGLRSRTRSSSTARTRFGR